MYSKQTKFASDPTSKSSIIGIDFYLLGQQGEEEFGPYGELFPLSDPKGSGFMKCIEDEVEVYSQQINYLRNYAHFHDESGSLVVEYEIKGGRQFETSELLADCKSPITDGIVLDAVSKRTFEVWPGYDELVLTYKMDKSQLTNSTSIFNATTSMLTFCLAIRLVEPDTDPPEVLVEEFNMITQQIDV